MNRVLKNEWVAESGSGCGMRSIVTKVHHNYVTLYHEPKSSSRWGLMWIVFAALFVFTIIHLFKGF